MPEASNFKSESQWKRICHDSSATLQLMPMYLALGDSYTKGEGVDLVDNFPHQLCRLLERKGIEIGPPTIIAETGWTTGDLLQAIENADPGTNYDLVTLLIGVNNQYRGLDQEIYVTEFEAILKKAIAFARGVTSAVYVVSIPDWSVTPFAHELQCEKISRQIDSYNAINLATTIQYGANYIEITNDSRMALIDDTLITHDGLHPSAKEYFKWAKRLAESIIQYSNK
jgi:lysophospholipase L1-like esterase